MVLFVWCGGDRELDVTEKGGSVHNTDVFESLFGDIFGGLLEEGGEGAFDTP